MGGELVRALADAGHHVRALTRGMKHAPLPAGVEAVQGDLNQPATLTAALRFEQGFKHDKFG